MVKAHQADIEQFQALMAKGTKAKPGDVVELRNLLARCDELWRATDAALMAERSVTGKECPNAPMTATVLDANYDGRVRELEKPSDGPLERVLVRHAALCWLRLQVVEQKYSNITTQDRTFAMGDYWERRLNATQRRFLRACEALARIRRLALPVVQVNVGDKQINIAANSAP